MEFLLTDVYFLHFLMPLKAQRDSAVKHALVSISSLRPMIINYKRPLLNTLIPMMSKVSNTDGHRPIHLAVAVKTSMLSAEMNPTFA